MLERIFTEELLRKGYLVIPNHHSSKDETSSYALALILGSFESLGYTLNAKGIQRISGLSTRGVSKFYNENYKLLEDYSGAKYDHRVFYKNFPNIENISVEEKYIRAVLHYLTVTEDDYGFMNDDLKEEKRIIFHSEKKVELNVINEKEAIKLLVRIAKNHLEGKVAISYENQHFLTVFLKHYKDLLIIDEIPFKENIASFIACLLYQNKRKLGDVLSLELLRFVKTPTDLLRVYAALSKGDVTLRHNSFFISLDRKCRRLFLSILNEQAFENSSFNDDLLRHDFLWKRVFELLHVGEYEKQYPFIYRAAYDLRHDIHKSFYSKLEALKENQKEYFELLKTCPGEFARRIDMLLRNPNYNQRYTLDIFKEIVNEISTNVLLSMWEHFNNRKVYEKRLFKINTSKTTYFHEEEDNRLDIDLKVIEEVIQIITHGLESIYSTYENKGKVYLSEEIKQYALPRNTRNASSQNKTLTYGTKIKLKEEDVDYLRFFTHFKNIERESISGKKYQDRVDVDLTFDLLNENMEYEFSIGWFNIDDCDKIDSYFSGDITTAPKGASEFIDLNYKQARKVARYVAINNTVYTGQDFCDIPECFSGVMFIKKKAKDGQIFNPELVEYKFQLTQKSTSLSMAFIVDLETLELIWVDAALPSRRTNVVASQEKAVSLCAKDALKKHMNLYEFMLLHKGHCTFVDNKEDADIIVSVDDDATLKPFDVEKIAAEWL